MSKEKNGMATFKKDTSTVKETTEESVVHIGKVFFADDRLARIPLFSEPQKHIRCSQEGLDSHFVVRTRPIKKFDLNLFTE